MHCSVGNIFRCKSAKNYKIRLRFTKLCQFNIKQMEMCSFWARCILCFNRILYLQNEYVITSTAKKLLKTIPALLFWKVSLYSRNDTCDGTGVLL